MWYDKRTMRALFYIGVMLALFGVGTWKLDYTVLGIVLLIIGVSCTVIGYWGLKVNVAVEKEFRKRQRKA